MLKARVLHYTRLERLASDKLSNLLCPFVSLEEKKFYEYGPRDCIGRPSFSFHLLMGAISSSVTLH